MLIRTASLILQGLSPVKIEVEIDAYRGIPGLVIIGLAAKVVDEAKERITASLTHCGIRIRSKRTVVNLAPATLRKTSSALDLSIAIGLLKLYGELKQTTDNTLFLGELALDGQLKYLPSCLAMVMGAKKLGYHRVVFPSANVGQLVSIEGIKLMPIYSLHEYLVWDKNGKQLPLLPVTLPAISVPDETCLLNQVHGQAQAKRALIIAAAGRHHVLMTGPPGVGKTLLAQSLAQLLPALSVEESLEVHQLRSLVEDSQLISTTRPFRSPHHQTSMAGMIGGTTRLRPGEITLAHHGVLFLDELPEFRKEVLNSLRQPIEQGQIHLANVAGSCTFPCSFTLIATANPCPCGYWGVEGKKCDCNLQSRQRYKQKCSGPFMDRIELHVPLSNSLLDQAAPFPQYDLKKLQTQIQQVRDLQQQRYSSLELTALDRLPISELRRLIHLTPDQETILERATKILGLSLRGYQKIIRVSQTIADLENSTYIKNEHLGEALQYRAAINSPQTGDG